MIIPHDQLETETLVALIEEFVTRDGTDYGVQEMSLGEKVCQVKRQLENGNAVILFSESTGLCNIVAKENL